MRRSLQNNYLLKETEPATRYVLSCEGEEWEKEFSTVAAAYFYARTLSAERESQLVVFNQAGERCTLFLF